MTATLVRPVKELKAFRKVELEAGETKTAAFTLPKKEMGFYDNDGVYRLEDGLFRIYAGGSSATLNPRALRVAQLTRAEQSVSPPSQT